MHILSLDVGTSAVKAAVIDCDSARPVAPPVRIRYEIDHPTQDAAEIPPERLRSAVWQAAGTAVAAAPHFTVAGVGFSCLMPALVLLDSHNRPLSPIWIHLDRRSRAKARLIQAECGEEFLNTCGNRPLPGGMSALCYLQQIEDNPSLRNLTKHYLHANGWLAWLLTGTYHMDPANASFTGLWNTLTDQRWSYRWCERFDVDPQWLPEVVCGSTTVGGLLPHVAQEWNVPAGIPVKIGTADTSSGMLAARMLPGDQFITIGTTTVLTRFVNRPKPDPRRLTRRFGVGPSYIYAAHNPVGGAALKWLHQLCYRDQTSDEFHKQTIPRVARRNTEVLLDPPFLGGDRLEIESRRAAFRELTLATDRDDLLAATLTTMRDGHLAAFAALDWETPPTGKFFLTGGALDTLKIILPELANADIQTIEEGALHGVARLFTP